MTKKTENPQPVGRPKFEITEEICMQAERLASQGLIMTQIATVLGIAGGTLFDKQSKNPELEEAIKKGRAKGIATVTNALFDKATSGDNVSMIFYLKNRDPDNWEEIQKRQYLDAKGDAVTYKKLQIEIVEADDSLKTNITSKDS